MSPIYSAVIAQNPSMICAFFSREDHLWNAYSINGQFLTDLSKAKERQSAARILNEDCSHIVSPLVVKDTYSMDKLVYGTERGSIILRTLPSLQRFRRLPVSQEHPVLTVLISPDRRFLHVGCGDGGLIVITETSSSNQSSSRPQSATTGKSETTQKQGVLSSIQSMITGRKWNYFIRLK